MKHILGVAAGCALLGLAAFAGRTREAPLASPGEARSLPADAPAGKRGGPDPAAVEAAVERGLRYLERTQDRQSGGWVCNVGYKFNSDYFVTTRRKPHVGVSALSLMAFLSGGHLPGRGSHGKAVARGTDFILRCVDRETGYISKYGTRMYSHAFASLFLAEIYGMTHRTDLKRRLQMATDCTVKSQNRHGSWRYLPQSPLSDMSITVCQIMALRSARNIGLRVPKSTIDRAQAYVDRSAIKRRGPNYGAFRYQETGDSRTTFSLTAAGVAALFHAGVYGDNELMNAGINYLRRHLHIFTRTFLPRGHYYFWYGQYYAAQVFFFADDLRRQKGAWNVEYWPYVARELLRAQRPDGAWPNRTGPGQAFSTAVAAIILQIPNQYLPIFQR